jgi:hydroxymethylpyrimidine pyrophosphatase-like HAD family hydrolase
LKFCTLALDFDGTIAEHDRLEPKVRQAIAELRSQGITVLIVTGRILEDLERVAGDLHMVDAVVAENGAVIAFPDSGYIRQLGAEPPPALLAALAHERIALRAGRSVVETDAREAARVLAVVQRLELPLALAFNRARLMVLPHAVSKATGLMQALQIMRLSPRNAVAIGDAENDHELLRVCELGVAVAWGSSALKASADAVLPGSGPLAVADYVLELAKHGSIPHGLRTRRKLLVGHTDAGAPLALSVRGRNLLVAGDPKSGKSWVTGLLCEQLILHGYSLCILDPEGDYTSLEALPGVVVFGGADPLPRPRDLLRSLRHADVSVVIDLSHAAHGEKIEYLRAALPALARLRRHTGLPHRVVVDEAHYFLHEGDVRALVDLELGGYTLVSYRVSALRPELLAASEVALVTRESDPAEVRALRPLCAPCAGRHSEREWESLFENLRLGEAVALPITEEAERDVRRIRLAPRLTPHVRHFNKYIDIPVPASRAFAFEPGPGQEWRHAGTLREFVHMAESCAPQALAGYLSRRDFSRWIAEVFGDYPLARSVRALEVEHAGGRDAGDVARAVALAIRARYELASDGAHWPASEA